MRFWNALAGFIHRRFVTVLVLAVLATAGLAVGITQLDFETSQESLIGEDTQVAQDNRAFQSEFGGEAMIVLFTGDRDTRVQDLFEGENLAQLTEFDRRLRETGRFHSVITPLTAVQFAANQFSVGPAMIEAAATRAENAARAEAEAAGRPDDQIEIAAQQARAPFDGRLFANLSRLGPVSAAAGAQGIEPFSLENPAFVRFLIYENAAETVVRPIMRDAFPDPGRAMSIIRLPGNLDIAEMGESADEVKAIAEDLDLEGFEVLATGSPVLLQEINDYLQGGMTTLGLLAIAVMLAVLALVFRVRWRLLSFTIVLVGAIWGFGLMGFSGIPLTLITISGLPILVGVGVDFAIQTHSRFEEEVDLDGDARGALTRVMTRLAPALVVAVVAAIVGFLALQISEVPLIRDFGRMLALGIAALFVAGVAVPAAMLVWRERRKPTAPGQASVPSGILERAVRWLSFEGRRDWLPVSVIAVVAIVGGLTVEGRFTIQTDPEKWVPQDGEAVTSLEDLRAGTGFSSELSLLVQADDVTSDDVASWMQQYAAAQVAEHPNEILRGSSLPAVAAAVTGAPPGQEEMDLLLGGALDDPPVYDVAPKDIVDSFVTADRSAAAIVFPIAPLSLSERDDLLADMTAALDPPQGVDADVALAPPAGTTATPAGLAVIGVELVDALEANRALITWAAIGAVTLWLLLFYRRVTKALLPLAPVLIAVGLSSLITFLTGIELSPLTSVTGPLVIATCTEFSVLIMARYIEERERGLDPEAAVAHGTVRIGRAFAASGLTTVGGFGVLAFSDFPLLRDFGILVGLNVLVALLSALVVLPALLIWADRSPRIRGFTPGAPIPGPEPAIVSLDEAPEEVPRTILPG